MQMPWHKHVLLLKFLLADALLSLPLLLERPDVDQPLSPHLSDAGELVYCPVADGLVGEVVDHCDGDEGVAGFRAEGQVEAVCCEQLIVLGLFLCSFEEADGAVCAHHEEVFVDAQILAVPAAHVEHQRGFGQFVEKGLDLGPGFVPGMGEVGRNLIVYLVDMLLLHLCGQTRLRKGNIAQLLLQRQLLFFLRGLFFVIFLHDKRNSKQWETTMRVHLIIKLSIFFNILTSQSLMMLISSTGTFSSQMLRMTEERLSSFSSLCQLCMVYYIQLISRSLFCWSIHLMHSFIYISIARFLTFFRSPYFQRYCSMVSLQLSTSSLSYSICRPMLYNLLSISWFSQEQRYRSFLVAYRLTSLWQRFIQIWSFFQRRQLFSSLRCLLVSLRLWMVVSTPQSCFSREQIFLSFYMVNFFRMLTYFLHCSYYWRLRSWIIAGQGSVKGTKSFTFLAARAINSWKVFSRDLSLYRRERVLVVSEVWHSTLPSLISSSASNLLNISTYALDQFEKVTSAALYDAILALPLLHLSSLTAVFLLQSFSCCLRFSISALERTSLALVEMGFSSKRLKLRAWLIFSRDLLMLDEVFLKGMSTFFMAYPQETSRLFLRDQVGVCGVWMDWEDDDGTRDLVELEADMGTGGLSVGLFLLIIYFQRELELSLTKAGRTACAFSSTFLPLLLTILISILSFEVPSSFSMTTLFFPSLSSSSV